VSGWAAFIESASAADHAVQVYDDERDLATSVASFLDAGFKAEAPAVVIATAAHWPPLAAELEAPSGISSRSTTPASCTVRTPPSSWSGSWTAIFLLPGASSVSSAG
jgi:hypothetical protein